MDTVTRKIDDDYWADTKEAYEAWERLTLGSCGVQLRLE